MAQAIAEPRENLSPYAPRVFMVEIRPDQIGEVIGPGGKVIKKIEAETGAKISIEQDGRVYITSIDEAGGLVAVKMVEDITREVRVGEVYTGRVTRTESYGAFVELLPNKDGLVHISQLGSGRVARTEDVVRVGDEVVVKVISVDDDGKVRLTCRIDGGEGEPSADYRDAGPPRRDRDDRGDRGGRGGGRPDRRPERQPERPHDPRPPDGDKDESGPVPQARFRPKR